MLFARARDPSSLPLLRRTMTGDAEPFLERSEDLARLSRTVRARRVAVCACLTAVLTAAVVGSLMIAARDAGRWGARRYARAEGLLSAARENCDYGLRRSYFWHGPVVSRAMCAEHTGKTFLPEGEKKELRFMVIGDWGRDGMCCQRDVAAEMDKVARDWGAQFVLNTGDNFYNIGIETADDRQVRTSWSEVYHPFEHLGKLRWLNVAGNHDHVGNVLAQIEMGRRDKRWHMPGLRYYETIGDVLFAFVDTTPMYYPKWELPSFRMNMTDPRVVEDAIADLDAKLGASKARLKIVVGHHPLYCTGHHGTLERTNLERMQRLLKPVFRKHKVHAYICGHEHSLEHAVSDGVHYLVSGAGSKVRLITKYIPENRFAIGRQGFMAVAIRKKEMAVHAIDMTGVVVHTSIVPLES